MNLEYTSDRKRKLDFWKRNRDFTDGADAVKSNKERYVTKRASLPIEDYNSIMLGTEMFSMAARTLQSFIGLVFRQRAVFDGQKLFPPAVSIDGQTPEELVRACFREFMVTNDGGLLIDTPDTPPNASVADVEKLALYPYQTLYPAESIRELRYRAIGGAKRLVYVRIVEDESSGREMELVGGIYRATLWTKTTSVDEVTKASTNEWSSTTIIPTIAGKPMTQIPFIYLGDGDTGAAMDDLCETNRVHFNKMFLLAQAEAWVSNPVMVTKGLDEDFEISLIPGSHINLEGENADFGWLEYKGDSVAIIERTLDRLEHHASLLGSRMLIQEKSVSEAEGTVARRQAGESSILASQARHVASKATAGFKIQAEMMRRDPGEVNFTLNTNFVPHNVDAAVLGQLLAYRQSNLIPDEALFEGLQKMEFIDESWDYETFMAALDIQKGTTGGIID